MENDHRQPSKRTGHHPYSNEELLAILHSRSRGHTLGQIGAYLGITKSRIRDLEQKGMRKIFKSISMQCELLGMNWRETYDLLNDLRDIYSDVVNEMVFRRKHAAKS